MEQKREYAALDIAKWIAALLVVSIHVPPFLSVGGWSHFIAMQIVARFAVPFFFLTSGFLFFSKIDFSNMEKRGNKRRILHDVRHLLSIYLIWSALYLPTRLIGVRFTAETFMWETKVLVRDFLFAGIASHLWYLTATVVAIGMVFLLLKKTKITTVLMISAFFYLLGLLGDSYSFLIKGIPPLENALQIYYRLFVTTNNGIFFGFFFVSIGAYVAHKKTLPDKHTCGVFFSFFSIALVLEASGVRLFSGGFQAFSIYVNRWIFLVPAVTFLFLLLLQVNVCVTEKTYCLRLESLVIYLIHPLISYALGFILPLFQIGTIQQNSLPYFILVILIAQLFAMAVSSHIKKPRFFQFLFMGK